MLFVVSCTNSNIDSKLAISLPSAYPVSSEWKALVPFNSKLTTIADERLNESSDCLQKKLKPLLLQLFANINVCNKAIHVKSNVIKLCQRYKAVFSFNIRVKFCLTRRAKNLAGYTKGKAKETCLILFLACFFFSSDARLKKILTGKALQSGRVSFSY